MVTIFSKNKISQPENCALNVAAIGVDSLVSTKTFEATRLKMKESLVVQLKIVDTIKWE